MRRAAVFCGKVAFLADASEDVAFGDGSSEQCKPRLVILIVARRHEMSFAGCGQCSHLKSNPMVDAIELASNMGHPVWWRHRQARLVEGDDVAVVLRGEGE